MYDVAIIGAGPAGATAARLLANGQRVLLVDARHLGDAPGDGAARVCCGGLLAPAAQRELARQGLGVPAHVLAGSQLFGVRAEDAAAGLARLYQRFYVNVDRERFDRWLVSQVPEDVHRGFGWRLRGLTRHPDGTLLEFRTAQGGRATALARTVIGADGAASAVRRLAHPERALPTRYAAVQGAFAASPDPECYQAIFDAALTDFYGWVIPKGPVALAGLAVPAHADAAAAYASFIERLRTAGQLAGEELDRQSAQVVRPLARGDVFLGDRDVLLVGEAAGLISPSSAEGISYALASGAAVAGALAAGPRAAAATYRHEVAPLVARVAGRAVKARAIYAAPARRAIMRTGVGSIRRRVEPLVVGATGA